MTEIIINQVSEHYRISPHALRTKDRHGNLVKARHLYCYFMREFTHLSLTEIGEYINRDHATIIHGWRSIKNQLESYGYFRKEIDPLEKRISELIQFHTTADEEVFQQNDFFTN